MHQGKIERFVFRPPPGSIGDGQRFGCKNQVEFAKKAAGLQSTYVRNKVNEAMNYFKSRSLARDEDSFARSWKS